MALTQGKVEDDLPKLDLEQATEDHGCAAVGEEFEYVKTGSVLWLFG